MSSTPTSQNIYTLIDNLDSKLNRRGQIMEDGNYYNQYQEIKPNTTSVMNTQYEIRTTTPIDINTETQFIQIPIERLVDANQISINNPNMYLTHPQQIFTQTQTELSSPRNDYYIKQLIKEEFQNLINPYQNEIKNNYNTLNDKISKIQVPDIEKIVQSQKDNNINPNDYMLKNEYENKMLQINNKFDKLNSYCDQLKDALERMERLNNEKVDYESMINEFDDKINELNNKINNSNTNINSVKNEFQMQNDNLRSLIQNSNRDSKYDILTLENKKIKNDFSNLQNDFFKLKNQIDPDTIQKIDLKQLEKIDLYDLSRVDFNSLKDLPNEISQIENITNNFNDLYKKQNEIGNKLLTLESNIINLNSKNNLNNNNYNNLKYEIENLKQMVDNISINEKNKKNDDNFIDMEQLNAFGDDLKSQIDNDLIKLNNDIKDLKKQNFELQNKLNVDTLSKLKVNDLNNLPFNEIKNLNYQNIKEIPNLKNEINNIKNSFNNYSTLQDNQNLKNQIIPLDKKINDCLQKQNQLELRLNTFSSNLLSQNKNDDHNKISSNEFLNLQNEIDYIKQSIENNENNLKNKNLSDAQKFNSLESKLQSHINNDYKRLNNELQ